MSDLSTLGVGTQVDWTARDRGRDLSVLVVVWFQDEYAPPIQEPALGQLLALDWDTLATDVDLY